MRAYEINEFGIENLTLTERDEPQPQANEVLVKFHAASLNYRDLMMVKGFYNPKLKMPLVPLSDGAGEVVAIGDAVTKWKTGDRVCPIFMQGWHEGEISAEKSKTALGGGAEWNVGESMNILTGLSYSNGFSDVFDGERKGKNSYISLNLGVFF